MPTTSCSWSGCWQECRRRPRPGRRPGPPAPGIRRARAARRILAVALWCEADAYDQLFLVRVLAGMQTPPEHLELIEIDRVPGVERFVGIGQLAPELLAWLWTRRRPLDAEARAGPRGLGRLPRSGATALGAAAAPTPRLGRRCVGNCMNCRLRDGLSLSERLTLEIVRDGAAERRSLRRADRTARAAALSRRPDVPRPARAAARARCCARRRRNCPGNASRWRCWPRGPAGMAGGPTALTLIARTSATGAQPLSLRARFPRPARR